MSRATVWGIIALICAIVVFIDLLVFTLRPFALTNVAIYVNVMNISLVFILIMAIIIDTITMPIEQEKTDLYDEILLWSGVIDALLKELKEEKEGCEE